MSEPPLTPRTALTMPVYVATAIVLAVLAGLVGGFIAHAIDDDSGSSNAAGSETRCPATTIADDVLPSVVTLSVTNGSTSGSGSGETIRSDGYVLTNNHVISAAANGGSITVTFSDGQAEAATLVGRSIALDLAVVKVTAPKELPTIAFGSSASLLVGQPVVALGAPLGLSGTVTSGIVSALGRNVPVPADNDQTALLPDAIQTDASINPGNSGGALVDCTGKLVGINTAIATVPNAAGQAGGGSVGIGFAIPVDLATVVADQLIATGTFTPPVVGVSTIPIPAQAAERFGVSGGLYVQAVTPGGPAAQAGIQAGDVITSLDGSPTTSAESLVVLTLKKKPGDQVMIDYVRDGTSATATVTLGASP